MPREMSPSISTKPNTKGRRDPNSQSNSG
jgi:hypothetical protein